MVPLEERLLDAAAALAARGEPVSVAAVAAEAGIARGTVYKRYPDREALVAALVASGRGEPKAEPDIRARILDAVGVVIRRQGLAATTLEEVAEAAGVGAATVYRRFGDRRGLLQAFVAERTPRSLATELRGERDADLFRLARESLIFFRDYREIFMMSFSTDPEARALVAEARGGSTSVRELMASVIDRHLPDPTGRNLAAFQGILMGVAWMAPGDPDADAAFVVSTFLHGVLGLTSRERR